MSPQDPVTPHLAAVLDGDRVLAALGDPLLRQAMALIREGFAEPRAAGSSEMRIAPHQMSGLAEQVRRARDLEEAKREVRRWIKDRIRRLKRKKERTGRTQSWLCEVKAGSGPGEEATPCLGQRLLQWVEEEQYLGPVAQEELQLRALKQAFYLFHGLYRLAEDAIQRGGEVPEICDPQLVNQRQEGGS